MSSTHHRLIVTGAANAGKSALVDRLIEAGPFQANHHESTIARAFNRLLLVDGQPQWVTIEDTAGDDEFSDLRDATIRSGDGCLIIVSVASITWRHEIGSYVHLIRRLQNRQQAKQAAMPVVLVCSKCDVRPMFSKSEVRKVAKRMGVPIVMETSAKTRSGVDEAFGMLVRQIRDQDRRRPLNRRTRWTCGWSCLWPWAR